ncbi:hypothetical protein SETIT_9G561300v2 [Setaria italica]|uniref:Uncharacterized protein n=1 Tax=Setaria italica TaxID=4555 RepID=A0A368SZB3_SETIT|nr:hypothetical protein SETIT_9G561300v2 [Setaria italica]
MLKYRYGSDRVRIFHAPWGDLQVWRPRVWIKEEPDGHAHHLDDHVLFLGSNQAACSCAEEYSQLKLNHLYFMILSSCLTAVMEPFGNKCVEEIIFPWHRSKCLGPWLIIPNPIEMDSSLHS